MLMTGNVNGGGVKMPRRIGTRHHRNPHVLWYFCGSSLLSGDTFALLILCILTANSAFN
jgi:hypothetical protein